jgi:cellulose synthase/poly-beta-1,6-N-acetylglucosamine synthase-like glycosyltransferase
VAKKGYTIKYNPEAYAIETASANINEELKRKIRISAGGIQAIIRLRSLLNIFKYGILSFQYISHRVLRWTITPVCLILLLPISMLLSYNEQHLDSWFFTIFLWIQLFCYISALVGWYLENKATRVKALFVPYYFVIMNLSVLMGFFRYMKKLQSVNWERAKRAQ